MANSTLNALSPREAVADALYRCVLGIDSNNHELFESACVKDESMTAIAEPIVSLKGWTAINKYFDSVFALVTAHTISNIRVEFKDNDNASMTANAVSYHVRPDEAFKPEDTSYTAGSLYSLDLVRDGDDGLWKIKKWMFKILWTTGDSAVVHG